MESKIKNKFKIQNLEGRTALFPYSLHSPSVNCDSCQVVVVCGLLSVVSWY